MDEKTDRREGWNTYVDLLAANVSILYSAYWLINQIDNRSNLLFYQEVMQFHLRNPFMMINFCNRKIVSLDSGKFWEFEGEERLEGANWQ